MRNRAYPIFRGKNSKKNFNKQCGYPIIIRSKQVKIKVKKNYKDTIFTKLFNNKETAIQLYNALYHKNLPKNTPIEIVTLDDVLFTKRKNDVAFIIDGHFLIFIEHQSTINENMPLRLLFYVIQEYEKIFGYKIIKGKQISNPNLYKKEQIKIPKPEFFALYNGTENLTETAEDGTITVVTEKLMKLSDAFIESNENPNSLELCIKVIDVRYHMKHQSLKTKETLSILGEYSYFMDKVETYKDQGLTLEEAIKETAKICIQTGILRDFLLKNETEVVTMLIGVYDEEMEKQVIREEAEARGEARGRAEGAKAVIEFALDLRYSNEEIISILKKKLKITEQQADNYLRRFYNKSL